MDRKQSFSIASKQPDDQKRSLDDRKRLLEIETIRDPAERQHHQEAMKLRDEKLKIEKERGDREKRDIINREVQKQLLAKEKLQLTMKKADGLPLEQRKAMLHQMVSHNVEITHGAELKRHEDQILKDMNAEIDRGIKESLVKQERKHPDAPLAKPERRSLDERQISSDAKQQERGGSLERSWKAAARSRDDDSRKPQR